MANTSTIHIKTDFDCKVYDYGQELGTTKADTFCNFELRKGEHELTFVYTEDESVSKTITYEVKDADCDYQLIVEIIELLCNKAKDYFEKKNYTSAFLLFSTAAKYGNAMAQNYLGECYEEGKGVEEDFNEAVSWYTKAVEQGNASAQYHLAQCFDFLIDVRQHLEVKQNLNSAERHYVEYAVDLYTKAAKQGHAGAQYLLGLHYEYGGGVERCITKAIDWYTKAAEQGDAEAQCQLGNCYLYGKGVEENIYNAWKWYSKAAEQENAEAQYYLGCLCFGLCENHAITQEGFMEGVEWHTKAAQQGYIAAQLSLGYLTRGNVINGITDPIQSLEWFTKAAEQGNVEAQRELINCYFDLGECYEDGRWVDKDFNKAVEWYTKAAKQGNEDAKKALDRLKPNIAKPKTYLFFDTETTGIPRDYNAPASNSRNWPRLVQLSWITTDEDCNILSQNDFIIYPEGFTIPSDAAKLHGITTAIAKEKGKPLEEVLEKFMEDFKAAKTIVGHNIAFDKKIVGAELIRLGQKDIMDSKKSLCTMEAGTDYCKIRGYYGYKWPKLQELHKKLFGCEFEDAHNSMSDVTATLKCFKEMRKRGLI